MKRGLLEKPEMGEKGKLISHRAFVGLT